MFLINELLALKEDTSKEAIFHIDTPELRVIEAKTKHAVGFFNEIYFEDEEYQPFKYGIGCYFVIRNVPKQYDVIRISFKSKQFITRSNIRVTLPELRNLCHHFPQLYDVFEVQAKKEGILACVKYDHFTVEDLTKSMGNFYKHQTGRRSHQTAYIDMSKFKPWFDSLFGAGHMLPDKLQQAFVAAATKTSTSLALLHRDIMPRFDPMLVCELFLSVKGSGISYMGLEVDEVVKYLLKDKAAVMKLLDELLPDPGPHNTTISSDMSFNSAVNELISTGVDLSPYINDEKAVLIGAGAGADALKKMNIKVDDELATKVITRNPARIKEFESFSELNINKLKEKARVALLARAGKR